MVRKNMCIKRKEMVIYLSIIVQISFLLSLDFNNSIHEIFMSDGCGFPTQRNHTLNEVNQLSQYKCIN